MFERLQKPFLTVETGEAYQPIRLSYALLEKGKLAQVFNKLKCFEKKSDTSWQWFWRDECNDLHFESLDNYKKSENAIRLGTVTVQNGKLYFNLPSFKRACLAVPFFHKIIDTEIANVESADFINKVFGLDEHLPHGFTELFKEDELEKIVHQRIQDYAKIQEKIENAETADDAFNILSVYTQTESKKRLPFAERYQFQHEAGQDADVVFLGFYIFLRGRELVAIKRWFGETGYNLADAAEDTVEQVFGGMNIDIIE